MRTFPARRAALSVALLVLMGSLTPALDAAAAPVVGPAPVDDAPPSPAELMGLAAIAGAGLEVRHVMQVAGPDPALGLPLNLPSTSPGAPAPGLPLDSTGALGGVQAPPAGPVRSLAGIPAAWHSGASGDAATDGSLGSWRGEPLQILGTWNDTTAESQRDIGSLRSFSGWDGDIDVAIGALAPGESWAQAASGAYVDRWTQAVRNIRAQRSGHSGVTYIRFAHEMTGDWYTWKVNSGNVADFRTAWRLFHSVMVREYPQAKLVFSPNEDSHSDISLDRIWPGDDVVDVVGPDTYDGYPDKTSESVWDDWVNSSDSGGPRGIGAWRSFAAAHGKPLALPEWGLRDRDNPLFIRKMHDFLVSCAPRAGDTVLAGKCVYDIYFNIPHSGNNGFMIYGGPNPTAAETYRSLVWGSR